MLNRVFLGCLDKPTRTSSLMTCSRDLPQDPSRGLPNHSRNLTWVYNDAEKTSDLQSNLYVYIYNMCVWNLLDTFLVDFLGMR